MSVMKCRAPQECGNCWGIFTASNYNIDNKHVALRAYIYEILYMYKRVPLDQTSIKILVS